MSAAAHAHAHAQAHAPSEPTRPGLTPEADAEVRALLRESAMDGLIQVALTREPNLEHAASIEGSRHQTFLARDREGALVGMGTRSVRRVFHRSQVASLGYLGQLRTRGRSCGIKRLRAGFAELDAGRLPDELPFDLTAIVSDNEPARRLLERGLPGLPKYTPVGEIETLVCSTRTSAHDAASALEPEALHSFVQHLNAHHRRHAFAPAWQKVDFGSSATRGLEIEHLRVLSHGDGRIRATGAVWDQRAFKQAVVTGYKPALRWSRPLVNLGLRLARQPALPPAGSTLKMAYASHLAFDADDFEGALALVRSLQIQARARGLEQLAFALAVDHPLRDALRKKLSARPYRSMLYAVGWDRAVGATEALGGNLPWIEVATL